MGKMIIRRMPEINGGMAITFQGDAPDQAVYWRVVGVNPQTNAELAARGYLKWRMTRTNKASQAINYYYAPPPKGLLVRYDTGRVYDSGVVYDGDDTATYADRIKVTAKEL